MAKKKTTTGKAGGKRKRQPPRKIPLILQTKTVEVESGDKREVTFGQLVVLGVRSGGFRAEAAAAAGISRTTVFNWAKRGDDALALAQEHTEDGEQVKVEDVPEKDRPYVDFVNALEEAEAQAEQWHVRNLKTHAEKDPKVSQWFLARRWPDRWGVREAGDSGAGGWTLYDLEVAMDEAAAEAA